VFNLANLLYIIALARGIGQSGNIFGLDFAELPMFFKVGMSIVLLLFVWVREGKTAVFSHTSHSRLAVDGINGRLLHNLITAPPLTGVWRKLNFSRALL